MQHVRGKNITAIFQEPMTSLNPLHTVEKQINEIIMLHSSTTYNQATKKTISLLIACFCFNDFKLVFIDFQRCLLIFKYVYNN